MRIENEHSRIQYLLFQTGKLFRWFEFFAAFCERVAKRYNFTSDRKIV